MNKLWIASGLAVSAVGLTACNSAPRAMDDSVSVPQGMAVNIPVLRNDVDPDGDPMIVKSVWGSSKGSVAINPDNTIAYTPYAGASGTDTFSYRVKDNHNHAKIGDVVVSIEPDRPVTVIDQRARVLAVPETSVAAPPRGDPNPPPPPGRIVTTTPPETVVVPAPVFVAPGGPTIQGVQVNLHTTQDDKNREEPVRVVVRRGAEVLADSTLGAGELRLRKGGEEESFAIVGGFLQVLPDKVVVMAETADMASDIDLARAEDARRQAEQTLESGYVEGADLAAARAALQTALIRIRVAERRQHEGRRRHV